MANICRRVRGGSRMDHTDRSKRTRHSRTVPRLASLEIDGERSGAWPLRGIRGHLFHTDHNYPVLPGVRHASHSVLAIASGRAHLLGNPKHEIRNTKQIRITEIQMTKTFWIFVLRACFGFRYSDFGFPLRVRW